MNEQSSYEYLHEPFLDISKKFGNKTAITYYSSTEEVKRITYLDLKHLSEEVRDIIAIHVPNSVNTNIIAICCNSGISAVVCMLGILPNGAFFYVPPELSTVELNSLLKRIPINLFLMNKEFFEKYKILFHIKLLKEFCILKDILYLGILKTSKYEKSILKEIFHDRLAYVICTSGSTGSPKIVFVPHKCIMPNITDLKNIFNVTNSDTILNVSPLTFDPSIIDIFLSISVGAELIMVVSVIVQKTFSIEEIIKTNPVSILQATPTFISTLSTKFFQTLKTCKNTFLRIIALGGEAFPSLTRFKEWFGLESKIKVYNLYGVTEMSCWASYHEVNVESYISYDSASFFSIPLGKPLTGTTLYLTDEYGSEVSEGRGHIVINGERNTCYIDINGSNQSEQSVMREIVTGDLGYGDGNNIFYVGRSDSVVKRNGCKIDLLEIESVSNQLHGVFESAAIFLNNKIYLYVVISAIVTTHTLKTHLENSLSAWKLPDEILNIPHLPLNKNLKTDKQALTLITREHKIKDSHKFRVDEIPENVAKLWELFLKGCSPKETDNFINLGGNSLQAVNLYEKIQEDFSVENSLILDTLLNGNLKDLCKLLRNTQSMRDKDLIQTNRPAKVLKSEKAPTNHNISQFSSISCQGGKYINGENILVYSQTNYTRMKIKWAVPLQKCIDASPLLVERENDIKIFIGSHSHIFACIDKNGRILWQKLLPDRIEASACMSNDGESVYIGCYSGHLFCLNIQDGRELWKIKTGSSIKSAAVVDVTSGNVVFGSYDKHLYCCSNVGTVIWKKQITNGSIFSSSVIMNGCIYTTTLDGYVVCVSITDGMCKWKVFVGKPIFSSPGVCSVGLIFGCTDNNIYCIGFDSQILWKFYTNCHVFSSPCIVERESAILIAIGSHDHNLYIIDKNGNKLSSVLLSSPIFNIPFIVATGDESYTIFVAETVGKINVLQLQLINNLWVLNNVHIFGLKGEIFSSPVFRDDHLYIGCRDDNFYCLTFCN